MHIFVVLNRKKNIIMATKPLEYWGNRLNEYCKDILVPIKNKIQAMGGKVCLDYYHNEDITERYTFFDVDMDGYGYEQFITFIETNEDGEVIVRFEDGEQCRENETKLDNLSATELFYVLNEIEQVLDYEDGNPVVVDYNWDEDLEIRAKT